MLERVSPFEAVILNIANITTLYWGGKEFENTSYKYVSLFYYTTIIHNYDNHDKQGLFTTRTDILPQDLVKIQSREIEFYIDCIALKYDTSLGNAAAETPVKFQNDCKKSEPNLAASRLREILR